MDWTGKSIGAPLYEIFSADPAQMPPTSMSIAIDAPDGVRRRALEASEFTLLKLKLGGREDHAMVNAIREVTDCPIRVDANEGYSDRETALREIEWLAERNVELVEQPLPADRFDDMTWLKQRSPLLIIADEAFLQSRDLAQVADCYHGINLKLVKCGGTLAARDAISAARSSGLKVMIGCTIESSLGIAAAAHLAPLADYADLDGNLLIANDPFVGHPVVEGRIRLRDAPGLGIP
jgi:L-alanine-DL-glutamate epimerase-like enolase superfamily enzyme